jgi:hypothetical protein
MAKLDRDRETPWMAWPLAKSLEPSQHLPGSKGDGPEKTPDGEGMDHRESGEERIR